MKTVHKIYIKDLLLRCIVGINPEERLKKQDVLIQIVIYADLHNACQSDNIADSVDYKTINKAIIDLTEGSSFFLLERLADQIADLCMDIQGVHKVRVTVEKPGALRFARSVGVEIIKRKS